MNARSFWVLAAAAAVLAAVGGFWAARELDSSAPALASGTWLPQPRRLPDFQLTDHLGRPFSRHDLQGHPSLVFFGFTHCPDVCPTTLAKLAQIKKAVAIANLQVLLFSVDPRRDTPTAMGLYVHAFDPDFIGVTGEPGAVGQVEAAFGVAAVRVDLPGGDYTMDHSAVLFLLNDKGEIAALFTAPFDARKLAKDIGTVAPRLKSAS
ncbi:MAG TPA: SCO family protein [Steroidobacteraceae bacterium]|nr:SCO family protein [Steroidobacteraceae bacterium]